MVMNPQIAFEPDKSSHGRDRGVTTDQSPRLRTAREFAELVPALLVYYYNLRGRTGFDVDRTYPGACRGDSNPRKTCCTKVSCQRRQLRTGCLKTSLLPTSWVCASGSGSFSRIAFGRASGL